MCLIAAKNLSARQACSRSGPGRERSGVPVIATPSAKAIPPPCVRCDTGPVQAKGNQTGALSAQAAGPAADSTT